jgi:hypothetical protein
VAFLLIAGVVAVVRVHDTTSNSSALVNGRRRDPHAALAPFATGEVDNQDPSAPGSAVTGGARSGVKSLAKDPAHAGGAAGHPTGWLPAGAGAHGVTDATLQVGMTYIDEAAAYAAVSAVGGTTVQPATGADVAKANAAAIDYINATGGIAGRKVEPIYHTFSAANLSTQSGREQEAQSACADWTEDHHVFAFTPTGYGQDQYIDCAVKTSTPLVGIGVHPYPSQSRYASISDYFYVPHGFVADRRERAVSEFAVNHGFFGKGAKVGVMIYDLPGIREGYARAMKPVLAAGGFAPAVEVAFPDMIQSPWTNYVLQMQAAGVTHIVFSASIGAMWATLFMMRAAEDQGYRPHWIVGSDNSPAALVGLNAPKAQMANLRGVGWRPGADTPDAESKTANAQTCAEVMKRAGQPPTSGYGQCEFLFFLRAAFERAAVVSPSGLAGGVAKLGDSYSSLFTVGGSTRFGPSQHSGPSLARAVAYDASCGCFQYAGSAQPLAG